MHWTVIVYQAHFLWTWLSQSFEMPPNQKQLLLSYLFQYHVSYPTLYYLDQCFYSHYLHLLHCTILVLSCYFFGPTHEGASHPLIIHFVSDDILIMDLIWTFSESRYRLWYAGLWFLYKWYCFSRSLSIFIRTVSVRFLSFILTVRIMRFCKSVWRHINKNAAVSYKNNFPILKNNPSWS